MQQGDFAIEHIIVDACSTDGTVDIIRHYAERYSGERYRLLLISEPDEGQSDAINKGLRHASGDVLAWLNADDEYEHGALDRVAQVYRAKNFSWCFGDCRIVDEHGEEVRRFITWYKRIQSRRYSYSLLLANDFIPQPAVFFSRRIYEQAGELERRYHLAMDYEYWLRLGRIATPEYIDAYLARFRWHDTSKSGRQFEQAAREALGIARKFAAPYSPPLWWHVFHRFALGAVYGLLRKREAGDRRLRIIPMITREAGRENSDNDALH